MEKKLFFQTFFAKIIDKWLKTQYNSYIFITF